MLLNTIYIFKNILYILGIFLIILAFCTLNAKNSVNSLFYLILLFINSANILFINNVEYLGILFIIIYVGAIAILFLFVIMLLNLKNIQLISNLKKIENFLITLTLLFIILNYYLYINNSLDFIKINNYFIDNYSDIINIISYNWSYKFINTNTFKNIAESLYNYYPTEIIYSSFLLLIAMLSGILITLKKKFYTKKQLFFVQINSKIEKKIKKKIIYINN